MTNIIRKIIQAGIVLTGVCSVLGYAGQVHRLLELANHFRVQYLWGAVIALLLMLLLKNWRWSVAAAALVALNAAHILPWYFTVSKPVVGQRLKLLQANIEYDNPHHEKLLALVQEEMPDIVTVQEVDQNWANRLEPLKATHPYAQVVPQATGSGLALYSRIKLETAERDAFGVVWRPGIQISFKLGDALVRMITIHPPTPTEDVNFPPRNKQFQAVAERLQSWPAPKILLGDLNDTVWSSYHAPLLRQAGMVNARQGHGIVPGWPSWLLVKPLMIPIDHCLVSPDIQVTAIRAGKNIGSDHLPLIVELVVPAQK